MKFLIAGLGSIGRRHLQNLIALDEKDIVLYRTGKSTLPDNDLERFPTEYSLEDALDHHPDAVIVSNPTALHLDVAIPAGLAGCHLLIEKPVSHSMERVDELQEAVEAGGGGVLVGYQFRFHPGILAVKEALEEGKIGDIIYARAHWGEYLPDWHPWEDYRQSYAARDDLGGGVALTLSHPFDYLRFILGDTSGTTGWARQQSTLDLPVEDLVEATIEFKSGATATVHLNYFEQPARHDLEIIGSSGTMSWSNATGAVSITNQDGEKITYFKPQPDFERNVMFETELAHFRDVIKGEAESRCTLEDGVEALKMALALRILLE